MKRDKNFLERGQKKKDKRPMQSQKEIVRLSNLRLKKEFEFRKSG